MSSPLTLPKFFLTVIQRFLFFSPSAGLSNLERDLHDCKSREEEAAAGRDAAVKKQRDSEVALERVQKEKIAIDAVLQTLKADMVKVQQYLLTTRMYGLYYTTHYCLSVC